MRLSDIRAGHEKSCLINHFNKQNADKSRNSALRDAPPKSLDAALKFLPF